MKIQLNTPLKDFQNNVTSMGPTIEGLSAAIAAILPKMPDELRSEFVSILNSKVGAEATVGRTCLVAIASGVNKDRSANKVLELYELGLLLSGAEEVELTPEQVVTLKGLVSEAVVSPMQSGQVCKILNG